jgi:hypothetical protein
MQGKLGQNLIKLGGLGIYRQDQFAAALLR